MNSRYNGKSNNKLILLFLMSNAAINLSDTQILRILSDLNIMSYFDIKDALYELCNDKHIISCSSLKGTIYSLTEIGNNIINEFKNEISKSIRTGITAYLRSNDHKLKIESEYKAEYFKTGENEYKVSLKIMEGISQIFEISMTVPCREQAEYISAKWPINAGEIYSDLILKLQ